MAGPFPILPYFILLETDGWKSTCWLFSYGRSLWGKPRFFYETQDYQFPSQSFKRDLLEFWSFEVDFPQFVSFLRMGWIPFCWWCSWKGSWPLSSSSFLALPKVHWFFQWVLTSKLSFVPITLLWLPWADVNVASFVLRASFETYPKLSVSYLACFGLPREFAS